MRTRWHAKLREVKAELKRHLHDPIPQVGVYLRSVVIGHARYHGVPMNGPAQSRMPRAVSNAEKVRERLLLIPLPAATLADCAGAQSLNVSG